MVTQPEITTRPAASRVATAMETPAVLAAISRATENSAHGASSVRCRAACTCAKSSGRGVWCSGASGSHLRPTSAMKASPASRNVPPTGRNSKNPNGGRPCWTRASLAMRLLGPEISVRLPPSRVPSARGRSRREGLIRASRAAATAAGSNTAMAPMLFITPESSPAASTKATVHRSSLAPVSASTRRPRLVASPVRSSPALRTNTAAMAMRAGDPNPASPVFRETVPETNNARRASRATASGRQRPAANAAAAAISSASVNRVAADTRSGLEALNRHGHSLAAGETDGGHAASRLVAGHGVQQRGQDPGAAAPDGVAQRDRPAVNVDAIEGDAEITAHAEDNSGKCFIDLKQIHVLFPPADLLEQAFRGLCGGDGEPFRRHRRAGLPHDPGQGFPSPALGHFLGGQHHGCRAVADATGVARRHGATLFKGRSQGGELVEVDAARLFVFCDDLRRALRTRDLHGRDLLGKLAPVHGTERSRVAPAGEIILFLARDPVLACQDFRAVAHV